MLCLSGITPECPHNEWLCREHGNEEYKIGSRKKHKLLLMKGVTNAPMLALHKPWWKNELLAMEKHQYTKSLKICIEFRMVELLLSVASSKDDIKNIWRMTCIHSVM